MSKKKQLGQFFTTEAEYIVQGLLQYIPKDKIVIDPFAGNWDLLNLVDSEVQAFDIDPKNNKTIQQDMLLTDFDYEHYWVLTNPPYLARNKSSDKIIFNKYNTNDLFKASIQSLIGCDGGILIVPLNFLCSKENKTRNLFLDNYNIKQINLFEEQVFTDTTTTVIAFSFYKKKSDEQNLKIKIFPSQQNLEFKIKKLHNYMIGEDFLNIIKTKYINFGRLRIGGTPSTKMFLRTIDTGSQDGMLGLSFNNTSFYGKDTDRTFASITSKIVLTEIQQKQLITDFNNIISGLRKKYNSLFLNNYRNSTTFHSRKRIGFNDVYSILSYLLNNMVVIA